MGKYSFNRQKTKKEKQLFSLPLILAVSPFVGGLSYHFLIEAFGLIILGMLCCTIYRKGEFVYNSGIHFILEMIFVSGVIISCFFAVDHGTAVEGAMRLLPILLFCLFLNQTDVDGRAAMAFLPRAAALMVCICLLGYFILPLRELFYYKSRMGGFFQYPNSCAFFYLFSLVILIQDAESRKKIQVRTESILLILGIILTGSRTTFVLFLCTILYFLIRKKKKALFWGLTGGVLVMAVYFAGTYLIRADSLMRLFRISLTDQYFLERLLFWKDGIGQICRHPFGMGYGGYFYLQPVFQSGKYTTRFVHNGWLQMILDYGIVTGISILIMVIRRITDRNTDRNVKELLLLFLVRMCFDFDLQYGFFMLCLAALLHPKAGEKRSIRIKSRMKSGMLIMAVAVACLLLYMSAADFFMMTGHADRAYEIAPWKTEAAEQILVLSDRYTDHQILAEKIIRQNEYSHVAWKTVSYAAFEQGDYAEMSEALEKRVRIEKFNKYAYQDYIELHYAAMERCREQNRIDEAKWLGQRALEIKEIRKEAKGSISDLARSCKDAPGLKWTKNDKRYLKEIEAVLKNEKGGGF